MKYWTEQRYIRDIKRSVTSRDVIKTVLPKTNARPRPRGSRSRPGSQLITSTETKTCWIISSNRREANDKWQQLNAYAGYHIEPMTDWNRSWDWWVCVSAFEISIEWNAGGQQINARDVSDHFIHNARLNRLYVELDIASVINNALNALATIGIQAASLLYRCQYFTNWLYPHMRRI